MNKSVNFAQVKIGQLFSDSDGKVYLKIPVYYSIFTREDYNAVAVNYTVLENAVRRIPVDDVVLITE